MYKILFTALAILCAVQRIRSEYKYGHESVFEPIPASQFDFVGSCQLPENWRNKNFSITSGGSYNKETQTYDSAGTILTYYPTPDSQGTNFICKGFIWNPIIDGGTGTCSSLSETETYFPYCYFKELVVRCETPVEGTVANLNCGLSYDNNDNANVTCMADGSWHPKPVPCKLDCGRWFESAAGFIKEGKKEKRSQPTLPSTYGVGDGYVIGGRTALPGEFSWIIGIYRNLSDQGPAQICGGSLISRSYILSAAHCFTDSMGYVHPKESYVVAGGKHYRDINVQENWAQVRKVKRLIVHEDFKGKLYQYRDDIALIEVEEKFNVGSVLPVCIDWKNEYENKDFAENTTAKVAGWGYTEVNYKPAEVLQNLVVQYRTRDDCRKNMDPEFYYLHYSSDKICAGFKNEDKGICNGDSGGGLYFASLPQKYYVRGIVSLTKRSSVGACDSNHYALYTKVSKYLAWIKDIVGESG